MLPRAGASGQRELLAEVRGGDLVRLEQHLAERRVTPPIFGRRLGLGQRQAELLREQPDRFLEAELLVQFEELEDVAADAAAEAVEEALVRVHVERRRLFGVERTEALVGGAGLLQGHVLLHHLHDLDLHRGNVGTGRVRGRQSPVVS